MAVNRDAIGDRGQAIVFNLLTRIHKRSRPLFRPQFLGDKYPAIDFFVELVDATEELRPFFLVQAKATRRGYTEKRDRLKAAVKRPVVSALTAYPAPTYIVGIGEPDELAFIIAAVSGGATQFSSIPTTHALASEATLLRLHEEVLDFWQRNPVTFRESQFR